MWPSVKPTASQRNKLTALMDPKQHQPQMEDIFSTRRQFLNRFGMGMGGLSLAWLLGPELALSLIHI
jgi:hypothetical protein